MPENVGFIGLGVMGRPMAGHLVSRGHAVTVYNRSRGPVDALVDAGATAAAGIADLARRTTIVITMLPDTPDVEAVLGGPGGVVAAISPGSIVIDMSSISPVATRRLASMVAEKGAVMLDAPVSGGEIGAIGASLSIMVGGDAGAFARVKPLLECMGSPQRIVHVGIEPGSGQVCKVANQIAIGGALAGVSEAFALARKVGVDVTRVREALLGGFASSRVLEVHGERMIKGNYAPGFRARLYEKDLRLANELAAAHDVPIPSTRVVAQLVGALVDNGGAELDYSAVATVVFERAGLPPQG
ncbi:MAG: NAD-binding protein [Luteitalea sp.]|nr:NAD-binding protein [Luteitalea sp.]